MKCILFFNTTSLNFMIVISIICFSNYINSMELSSYFSNEGNEKQVAYVYFNLSNHSFDETNYLRQISHCFTKALSRMISCVKSIHSHVFPNHRLWTINLSDRNPPNRQKDCNYMFSKRHLKTHFHSVEAVYTYSYHFTIKQFECKSNWNILGGSSFLITAYDQSQLIACRCKDSFDNKYHISCLFHRKEIAQENTPSCINITAMLDYEHYDAFGESLSGVASPYLKDTYVSLRHVFVDNQQYCFEPIDKSMAITINTTSITTTLTKPSMSTSISLSSSGRIEMITGEWLSETECRKYKNSPCYMYLNESNIKAYDNHQQKNESSLLSKGILSQDQSFPYIIRSGQSKEFSERYTFYPVIKSIYPEYFIVNVSNDNHVNSNNNKNTKMLSTLISPFAKGHQYHMIGSSHIRVSFDVITELYEMGYFPGGPIVAGNIHSYHAGERYSSVFADDQADGLVDLCNTFKQSTDEQTIAFMTGAWDLSFTPLRRLFHDPVTANKLASVILRILDGTIECNHLRRFIWLTEVPYSPCYDDDDKVCKVVKGYRTNSAISALNEYYIDAFSNAIVKEGLVFIIVDAYSIIAPRLQLLPDVEYDCSIHYHCKEYKHNYEPQYPKQIGHSPGGDAMVRAILLAMSSPSIPSRID